MEWKNFSKLCLQLLERHYNLMYRRFARLKQNTQRRSLMLNLGKKAETISRQRGMWEANN